MAILNSENSVVMIIDVQEKLLIKLLWKKKQK